jgi:hypothetical protein
LFMAELVNWYSENDVAINVSKTMPSSSMEETRILLRALSSWTIVVLPSLATIGLEIANEPKYERRFFSLTIYCNILFYAFLLV